MPDGSHDPLLYRHIVDTLVGDYERDDTTVEGIPVEHVRIFGAAWGMFAQLHRYARAALFLTDAEMAQEVHALVRIVIEYAVRLHLLVETGDAAVDALIARQDKDLKSYVRRAKKSNMYVPAAAEQEQQQRPIVVTAGASDFATICADMGLDGLYAVYGMESGFVHPSLMMLNSYTDEVNEAPALSIKPFVDWHSGNIPLIAYCLLWANRDLDTLIPGNPKRDGLALLAQSVGAPPMLPPYKPSPPKPRRRARRR